MDPNTAYEIECFFPVDPHRLFVAFTDAATLKHIWGLSDVSVDARVGGKTVAKMQIGAENWNFIITYTEVVPAQVLRWVTRFERFPKKEIRVTLLLQKTPTGTDLTLRQENFEGPQERDANRQAFTSALRLLADRLA